MLPESFRMRIEDYEVAGFVPLTDWLDHLPDLQARARIRARIDRLGASNPGRYEDLGGGDKPTQTADIKRAREYLAEFSRRNNENQIKQEPGILIQVPASPLLTDVVRALNALGATPQDLLAILQAIKAAGALNAELEVI